MAPRSRRPKRRRADVGAPRRGPLVLVEFEPTPDVAGMVEVPPEASTVALLGVSLADGTAGGTGQISLYREDCDVLETFSAGPGEYRLHIGPDGLRRSRPATCRTMWGSPCRLPP